MSLAQEIQGPLWASAQHTLYPWVAGKVHELTCGKWPVQGQCKAGPVDSGSCTSSQKWSVPLAKGHYTWWLIKSTLDPESGYYPQAIDRESEALRGGGTSLGSLHDTSLVWLSPIPAVMSRHPQSPCLNPNKLTWAEVQVALEKIKRVTISALLNKQPQSVSSQLPHVPSWGKGFSFSSLPSEATYSQSESLLSSLQYPELVGEGTYHSL